jgi:hypothetical protein
MGMSVAGSASVSVDMKRTTLGVDDLVKMVDVMGKDMRENEKADARAKRVTAAIVYAEIFMELS